MSTNLRLEGNFKDLLKVIKELVKNLFTSDVKVSAEYSFKIFDRIVLKQVAFYC